MVYLWKHLKATIERLTFRSQIKYLWMLNYLVGILFSWCLIAFCYLLCCEGGCGITAGNKIKLNTKQRHNENNLINRQLERTSLTKDHQNMQSFLKPLMLELTLFSPKSYYIKSTDGQWANSGPWWAMGSKQFIKNKYIWTMDIWCWLPDV